MELQGVECTGVTWGKQQARAVACAACWSAWLLAPCYWQQRIQAGDLSSHIYNAWLAERIARGRAPGLRLAVQSSNFLFDWMLSALLRAWGAPAAERLAVSIAVLVFFWCAFAFVWRSSRTHQAPWQLTPCLAILAYGWVFHMGLFNFYLSLGLSLGAMAVARRKKRPAMAAGLLLGLAYAAHALPVVWAVGVLAYTRVARALAPRHRIELAFGALAALAAAGALLGACFETRRDADQFMAITGADQAWIYGRHYLAISVVLLAAGALCWDRLLQSRGAARTVLDARFQVCALTAAAAILLPGGVLLPGCRAGLDFIAERLSLAMAVLFCALVAPARLPKALVGAMAAAAAIFFALLYTDERGLNRVEGQMERAAAQLPPDQRLVGAWTDAGSRINPLAHMVDRVCVGRCFSYANYEASTAGFRIRAERENGFVVTGFGDSLRMQMGGYVVRPRDLPLYGMGLCEPRGQRICTAALRAGDRIRVTDLRAAALSDGGYAGLRRREGIAPMPPGNPFRYP